MAETRTEMTQAQLAREMNVSRTAVTLWKQTGVLREDAFTKPGKTGKVIYEIAVDQVERFRDAGQALGNGIGTRTGKGAPDPAPAAEPSEPTANPMPVPDTVQDQLARAKLESQLRKNRIEASEEALRQGMLMSADDVRGQMSRIAGMMLQIFEGGLPDFAAVVAARFNVPQRDVLHLLRGEMKKIRSTAAMKNRAQAGETDEAVTARVETDA